MTTQTLDLMVGTPEAGDTTADNQNVCAQSLGHARASMWKQMRSITVSGG